MSLAMIDNDSSRLEVRALPVIEWKGLRVVTTETLAEGYGSTAKGISMNQANNATRFIEGVHFFVITGEDLQKLRLNTIGSQISSKARSLKLWTEKGAARMSKIVDSDEAWNFFEQMESAYFNRDKKIIDTQKQSDKFEMHMMFNDHAARMLNLPESGKLQMMRKTAQYYGIPNTLPDYTVDSANGSASSDVTYSLTSLLSASGVKLTAAAVNKVLEEKGILVRLKRKTSKGVEVGFWSITEQGLKFGKNVTSDKNQRETQPHYYKTKFPELLAFIGL